MKYIKLITLSLGMVILSVFAFAGLASAQSIKTGNTITVPASETIDSMLFASGSNIDIAGTVNGDVYCAGQTVTISGTVHGDVFCAGQTLIISGTVEGNVRVGGQSVTLSGNVSGSATVGSQDFVVDKSGVIGRDLLGGSQNVTVNGSVQRDVEIGARNMTVNGTVGRNVKGGVDNLSVGAAGSIGGSVDYMGTNDPSIANGGKITGTVTRTAPKKSDASAWVPIAFGWIIYVFFAMLALAMVLVGLFPRILNEATEIAIKKPGMTVLVGLAAMVLTPVLIVILFITAIGAPLAILTMLVWSVIMILSSPFAAYWLGRMLVRDSKQPGWIMLAGVSLLTVTYFIPIIGFITFMGAYVFGTGMILMRSKQLVVRPVVSKK